MEVAEKAKKKSKKREREDEKVVAVEVVVEEASKKDKKKKDKKDKKKKDKKKDKKDKKEKKIHKTKKVAEPAALPNRYGFADRVATESDVGILCYLSDVPGFDGTLRQRFSDFVVNEIDSQKRVVRLTDVSDPLANAAAAAPAAKVETPPGEDVMAELAQLLGAELHGKLVGSVAAEDKVAYTVDKELDKAQRTRIHQLVRKAFEGKADSSTKEGKIVITCGGLKAVGDFQSRGPSTRPQVVQKWPADRMQVLRFALSKANLDTGKALGLLAFKTNLNERSFRFAGNKDKRAVTTQHITVRQVLPSKILTAVGQLHSMKAGNFEFVDDELKIGQCWGNRFDIVLRFVSASDELVLRAVERVKRNGFINYYGLQRFGTTVAGTHIVGLAILRNELKNAVDLVLHPSCPTFYEDRDVGKAFHAIGTERGMDLEKRLLDSLQQNSFNYAGALQRLPGHLRSMYLHAYQGYVWNLAASERFLKGSRERAEVGDIVLVQAVGVGEGSDDLSYRAVVRVLTEADVGKYALSDVLLPIPGPGVTMPANFVGEKMRATMRENGFPFEAWPEAAKKHKIQGGYRKLICIPEDVTHELIAYESDAEPLIPHDQSLLDGSFEAAAAKRASGGKHRALRVSFNLPSGAFATMFFRELQKRETGRDYQEDRRLKWAAATTEKEDK
jgi:tRNA pseudouridine13 synthase